MAIWRIVADDTKMPNILYCIAYNLIGMSEQSKNTMLFNIRNIILSDFYMMSVIKPNTTVLIAAYVKAFDDNIVPIDKNAV